MVDNRDGKIEPSTEQIVRLCNRKFGVGSDGLIMIEETGFADFYMNFFNPDGSQSFCGNGSRCAVRFAQSLGIVEKNGKLKAIDALHDFESDESIVKIKMRNVLGIEMEGKDYIIHTGSPHYIIYRENIDDIDIITEARKIRYSERFKKEGINVNFVEVKNGILHMRTYERGVEDETLSCGTGVTAASLSYAYQYPELTFLDVVTRGGKLKVHFSNLGEGSFDNIWLCGPAQFVYAGEFEI